jgi:hypothetical protein
VREQLTEQMLGLDGLLGKVRAELESANQFGPRNPEYHLMV